MSLNVESKGIHTTKLKVTINKSSVLYNPQPCSLSFYNRKRRVGDVLVKC